MSLAKLLMPPPLEFLANFISIFAVFDVTLALERINGMVLFHLLVLGSLIFGIPLFLVYGLYMSTLWTTFNRSHRALCARILLKVIKLPMIAYIDLGMLDLWLSNFVAKLVLWPLVSSLARPPTCSHAVCWLETLSDTNYFWSPFFKLIAFLVDPTGLTLLQAKVSHMKLNFVIGQDIIDKVIPRRPRSHMRTKRGILIKASARCLRMRRCIALCRTLVTVDVERARLQERAVPPRPSREEYMTAIHDIRRTNNAIIDDIDRMQISYKPSLQQSTSATEQQSYDNTPRTSLASELELANVWSEMSEPSLPPLPPRSIDDLVAEWEQDESYPGSSSSSSLGSVHQSTAACPHLTTRPSQESHDLAETSRMHLFENRLVEENIEELAQRLLKIQRTSSRIGEQLCRPG